MTDNVSNRWKLARPPPASNRYAVSRTRMVFHSANGQQPTASTSV